MYLSKFYDKSIYFFPSLPYFIHSFKKKWCDFNNRFKFERSTDTLFFKKKTKRMYMHMWIWNGILYG